MAQLTPTSASGRYGARRVMTPMSDICTDGFRRDQMYTSANASEPDRKGTVNRGDISCTRLKRRSWVDSRNKGVSDR